MGIAQSTFEELKSQVGDARITFVADGENARAIFPGAEIIPRGFHGMAALIAAALASDLVICGGGGLFQDDDSLAKMPYWGLRLALLKVLGAEVVGYCLGVGPLRHAVSRFFGRLAFACMAVISVRDPIAYQVAKGLTRRTVSIVPDPALALRPAPSQEAEKLLQDHGVPRDGSPLIGVAARKWFHKRGSFVPHKIAFRLGLRRINSRSKFNKMTDLLADVLDRLALTNGAHILFLPTYNVAHEGDDQVCEEISKKMHSNRKSLIRISDPRLYKAVTGKLSVMLGARMHPTIYAAGMGTPVVGLAYNPKFNGFFQLIGRSGHLLHIEDFVENEMTAELLALIENSLRFPEASIPPAVSGLIERHRLFNAALASLPRTPLPASSVQRC